MIKYYLFFLFILFSYVVNAQTSDQVSDGQISDGIKQIQKNGMSIDQVKAAAAAKGMSSQDINKLQQRANKMQAGKTNPANKAFQTQNKKGQSVLPQKEDIEKEKTDKTVDKYTDDNAGKRYNIFGLDIFNNPSIKFEPNLHIATPRNYILGTGDDLDIDITGYAYAHYTASVSAEGNIKIENLNPIYVNGMTIEQASNKITQRLKSLFGGIGRGGLTASVTVSKIRSIHVNVIGQAVHPGTYTVPSLASVFNLLYEAGGPTHIGTMRNIELIRRGRLLRKFDLYDYLFHGDLKDNLILQDQDVINIPYSDVKVEIRGEIQNPKIFELKKNETLKNLLNYSGGFSDIAYQRNITLIRITDTQKKIITIDKNSVNSFVPIKGDLFEISEVSDGLENVVYLTGAVKRPSWYELESVPTLKRLINKAEGISGDAFVGRVLIKRKKPNLDTELIQIDYSKIMQGLMPDVVLAKNDEIIIKSIKELRGSQSIQISGEVNSPQTIEFVDNMTLSDAIMLSGGFTDGATASNIEISRRVYTDSSSFSNLETVEIIPLKTNKNLNFEDKNFEFKLKPYDNILIRKLVQYEPQKSVSINGEVNYPGSYTIVDKAEKISDLIIKSGGIKELADLYSAQFLRNGRPIGVDLKKILQNNKDENNLLLINGDQLNIPRKVQTVSINGYVYNPSVVPFQKGLSLPDYLSLAGGKLDSAFTSHIYVKYANNRMKQTKSFFGIKFYPKIEAGTEIIVPVRHNSRLTSAERIAVSSAIVSIAGIIITILIRVLPAK